MDFKKLAQDRKTTYEFLKKPVKVGDLKYILECASYAPSSLNLQPWKFLVIKNEKLISKLVKISYYGAFHDEPPVMIAVCIDSKEVHKYKYQQTKAYRNKQAELSVSFAGSYLTLAAESRGIKSCILSPQEDVSKLLKIKKEDEVLFIIGLGHSRKPVFLNSTKKELKDIVKYYD